MKAARGSTCVKCELRVGISCVCGLKLVHSGGNDSRVNLLPIDRIPKKIQYDPQTGQRFAFRSEARKHVREQNARLKPGQCKMTIE